ncbi:Tetratricopeptide repeat-containing protein [Sulfidibacter corallicola]|uniref:Tetratricopeptide repeat-containing protein n=1 Tax=Sulfidibacter corallicola TaxID=2818388 RepID=A0A8A4TLJ1_SULCO|nr:tetratricopeptide repeat protein [Sulfidibacter corallicola]QTD50433.1 tetratricopeptide repeat-containing protein [Sulfidibacter corallicola]
MAQTLGNAGWAHHHLGESRAAIEHFQRVLALPKSLHEKRGPRTTFFHWSGGQVYRAGEHSVETGVTCRDAISLADRCLSIGRVTSAQIREAQADVKVQFRAQAPNGQQRRHRREAPTGPMPKSARTVISRLFHRFGRLFFSRPEAD